MTEKASACWCLLALLAVAWAQPAAGADGPEKGKDGKSDVGVVVTGNTAFALDLYGKVRTEKKGNLFLSPASISTALAMTQAGAAGQTEAQMAKVLHLELPPDRLHPAFAALLQTWTSKAAEKGYRLQVANRLWGQQGYQFLPQYLQTTRQDYGAELAQVDFVQQTEKARQTINTWVEEQTAGKIKDLIPSGALDDMTRLVLTNAVYFKGDWALQFNKKETREAPFQLSSKEKVAVPLMFLKSKFKFGAADGLQVLELPYRGNDLSMLVLLPDKVDGLPAVEERLTGANLARWTAGLRQQEVEVYLPKFQMTSEFQLADMLKTMGMPLAFTPRQADFSKMNGRRDLFISAAIHKAFVDVNEEGTEAAAATGIVVGVTSVPIIQTFRADHPFLFLIRDNRSDSILFLGRVANPKG